MPQEFNIEGLFKGLDKELDLVVKAFKSGRRASGISKEFVEPVIEKISENAGQEMNALYCTFAVEHALNQAGEL